MPRTPPPNHATGARPPSFLERWGANTTQSRRSTGIYGRLFCAPTTKMQQRTGMAPRFSPMCAFNRLQPYTWWCVTQARTLTTPHLSRTRATKRARPPAENPRRHRGIVLSGVRPSSGKCFHARHSPWRSFLQWDTFFVQRIWTYGLWHPCGLGVMDDAGMCARIYVLGSISQCTHTPIPTSTTHAHIPRPHQHPSLRGHSPGPLAPHPASLFRCCGCTVWSPPLCVCGTRGKEKKFLGVTPPIPL